MRRPLSEAERYVFPLYGELNIKEKHVMSINKRDIVSALAGASIVEIFHKIKGKTPLESLSSSVLKSNKDKIINHLIEEAGDLSIDERELIKEAMNFDPVFNMGLIVQSNQLSEKL